MVLGLTGAFLNYKRPLLTALGVGAPGREQARDAVPARAPSGPVADSRFDTLTGLGAARVSADEALGIARSPLGEVELDRIELKREGGRLVWKVKAVDEREVVVDAATGEFRWKARYEKLAARSGAGSSGGSTDWGKLVLDLHTGKIGGEVGKALMTGVAVVLVFLSVSGVYLYAKPLLLRRGRARGERAAGRPPLAAASGRR